MNRDKLELNILQKMQEKEMPFSEILKRISNATAAKMYELIKQNRFAGYPVPKEIQDNIKEDLEYFEQHRRTIDDPYKIWFYGDAIRVNDYENAFTISDFKEVYKDLDLTQYPEILKIIQENE